MKKLIQLLKRVFAVLSLLTVSMLLMNCENDISDKPQEEVVIKTVKSSLGRNLKIPAGSLDDRIKYLIEKGYYDKLTEEGLATEQYARMYGYASAQAYVKDLSSSIATTFTTSNQTFLNDVLYDCASICYVVKFGCNTFYGVTKACNSAFSKCIRECSENFGTGTFKNKMKTQ